MFFFGFMPDTLKVASNEQNKRGFMKKLILIVFLFNVALSINKTDHDKKHIKGIKRITLARWSK